jgi:hypothetical protein
MQTDSRRNGSLEQRIAGLLDPLDCIAMYENAIVRARDDLALLALERATVLLDGKFLKHSVVPTRLHSELLAAGLVRPRRNGTPTTWRKINRGGYLRRTGLKSTATIDARGPSVSVLDVAGHGRAVNDPWIAQRAA